MKKSVVKIIGPENQQSTGEEADWKRKQEVTKEEVKAVEEMGHLNNEQAEEVIQFIKTFSLLLYNLFDKEMNDTSDGGAKVVSLHHKTKNKKAA